MSRIVLLFLVFGCISAAPVPDKTRVTLVRNSTFGFSLAGNGSKSTGILQGNKSVDVNLPHELAEKAPDIVLLENVNSGAGIAFGGSVSFGVIKDNILAGKNPFWRRK